METTDIVGQFWALLNTKTLWAQLSQC